MRCPGCAAEAPAGARFCPSCGCRLERRGVSGGRRQVTVVFCDLTESTALSGRLDPESLRGVMLRYYAAMRSCLEAHDGVVEKFIGDAVMGVFGLPAVHEDDALRATRAALAMRDAIDRLNDELAEWLDVRLNVRIGVEAGEVATAADTAAGAAAGQALVTGEAVNVAARLQQRAAPGEILIGEGAYALTGPSLDTTPLGAVAVRGKTGEVRVWRLRGVRGDDPAVNRRFDAPFVDRERETRELDAVFAEVAGRSSVRRVTLVGDAGVGKTRLMRHWADGVARRGGVLVGEGRCVPYGEGGALRALADALRRIVGDAEGPAHDVLHRGLFRNGMLGPVPEETLWAIGVCLREAGAPVLLTLDDLQWAGADLLDTLERLGERLSDVPVMVLCAARPEAAVPPPTIVLPPLTEAHCRRLCAALLETVAHDAQVLDRLVRRCEGNPFYLEQLVALISDGGLPEQVPPALRALLSARLDTLRAPERHVLACASVIGREFGRAELAELHGSDADDLLAGLTDRRLVEPSGGRYRFTSTLIQEVVYRETSKSTRADLHQRLADHLDRSGGRPAAVGAHLAAAYRLRSELKRPDGAMARLRDRAAGNLATGGDQALRHGDLARAAALLRDAYALTDAHPLVVERLGEAKIALGDAAEGVSLLRRALRMGDERVAGHARLFLGLLGEGASDADVRESMAVFEAAGDDLGLARAMIRLGQRAQADGLFARAREALERGLAHAIRADAEVERATALGALAVSMWLGPEPASAGVARCGELLSRHGPGRRIVQAVVRCPLAVLLALRGDLAEAERNLDLAGTILSELGHAHATAFVPMFAASVALRAGRVADAEELLRRAHDAATALADAQLRVTAARDLARVLYERGRVAEAYALAVEGLADLDGAQPMIRADLLGLRARVLAEHPPAAEARPPDDEGCTPGDDALKPGDEARGPAAEARTPGDKGWTPADQTRQRDDDTRRPTGEARTSADRGWTPTGEARRLADEAWALAAATDSPVLRARVLADRARVRAAHGDAAGAREDLAAAEALRAAKER